MKNVIKINKVSKCLLSLVAVVALGMGSQAFGMDINRANKYDATQLCWDLSNNRKTIKLLLPKLGDNKADIDGWTRLNKACRNDDLEQVELSLNNGAVISVNMANKNGETPLYFAFKNNNLKIVQLLLECGANVNQDALHAAKINSQDPTKQAIAIQILSTSNLVKRFDTNKKTGEFFNLTLEEQKDKKLSEFADRLAVSVRAKALDEELSKSFSSKFSKFAKEGKGQKYFDTNIKFSN